MCIYNFLYIYIYSYVYTLVNHKCIVNWIGSLNALNSKLVVFVTLVIMYLLAQWCASSKRAGLTNFWCLCHCIWIFTRFCSSFWHWKRCCVHAFHVFHVFLFLEWKISSRKKGVSIGYIMRASSFPVYLRSLSSVIWVLQKKTIGLAEQNFISGQSSVVGCLQSWRYEKQQGHAEAWWVWFWLPSRLVPPFSTLGVEKIHDIHAPRKRAEKWNWIVEIACRTLVFETAVIEEGIENITWALSIKQTPYICTGPNQHHLEDLYSVISLSQAFGSKVY